LYLRGKKRKEKEEKKLSQREEKGERGVFIRLGTSSQEERGARNRFSSQGEEGEGNLVHFM